MPNGNIIKINGKDIKDVKATQDIVDLKSHLNTIPITVEWTSGKYVTSNGKVVNYSGSSESYYASNDILMRGYTKLVFNGAMYYSFVDANHDVISGTVGGALSYNASQYIVSVPSSAVYFRYTKETNHNPNVDFTLHGGIDDGILIHIDELEDATEQHSASINDLKDAISQNKGTITDGKYININGAEVASSDYCCTDYLAFNSQAKAYTAINTVAVIAFYDANKTFLANYKGTSANTSKQWHTITNADAKYVRISCYKPDEIRYIPLIFDVLAETKAYLESGIFQKIEMESGYYINNSGNKVSATGYYCSDYIPFNGSASVYANINNAACIAIYNTSKVYIGRVNGPTFSEDLSSAWYDVKNPDGYYIRISSYKYADVKYKEIYSETIAALREKISQIEKSGAYFLSSFSKIICCGDSLTYGQVYTGASTYRRAINPYPTAIQKLTGTPTEAYAHPGHTASEWWDDYSQNLSNNHGLYIVFLGTNYGLTDTIDTDCIGTDPANFASTNTGCYGKILQTITNNGDKAILIHLYDCTTQEALETANDVIDQFSERYDFPTITLDYAELRETVYHKYPDGTGQNNLHFNDYGYVWLGNNIIKQTNNMTDADKIAVFQEVFDLT